MTPPNPTVTIPTLAQVLAAGTLADVVAALVTAGLRRERHANRMRVPSVAQRS